MNRSGGTDWSSSGRSLTSWEWLALGDAFNLADGHSRGWLTGAHRQLAMEIGSIYQHAVYSDQTKSQQDFTEAFFRVAGQRTALTLAAPIFHYSSSMSIDSVAQALIQQGRKTVSLISPTFDNLSALMQRKLSLLPVDEGAIWDRSRRESALSQTDAVFVVMPNNPTGLTPSRDQFESLVADCDALGIALIIDASFRFFGSAFDWDIYEPLSSAPSLSWFVVEDTGKTWGLAEMKVGFVVADATSARLLADITNDALLNVSPFVLQILTRMMGISKHGRTHISEVREVVATNRAHLRQTLYCKHPLAPAAPESLGSVEWIRLSKGIDSEKLCEFLRQKGVVVLPGGPFYWNNQEEGRSFLRVALLRDPRYFNRALSVVDIALTEFWASHADLNA
jgi:aspartate/methionine/tyrosine aminotransferase